MFLTHALVRRFQSSRALGGAAKCGTHSSRPANAAASAAWFSSKAAGSAAASKRATTASSDASDSLVDHRQSYALLDMSSPRRKLKPYIVKRRLNRCRTYEGMERNIRISPWRLNLVCQLAAGLPLQEAMRQLEFCNKTKAPPIVQRVLRKTANLADLRDGLQPSQLEVAECFSMHGTHLKRMKIMGRGRSGIMHHRFSHMRVVLREIDFKLKLYQAPTLNQKKQWLQLQSQAEQDHKRVQQERQEIALLKQQQQQKSGSSG